MKRIMIQAEEELLARTRLRAAERGVSVAQVVRDALERELGPGSPAPAILSTGSFHSGEGDLASRVSTEYQPPSFRS